MVQPLEKIVNKEAGNKEDIGAAIGRIPSGVYIVTAHYQDRQVGMLASWIQQVGFEPPAVSLAVHPERELYDVIVQSGAFTVNILSNENISLMKNFSRYSPDQFNGLDFETTPYGLLLKDVVADLQCRVFQRVDACDHHLFIAEVVDGDVYDHTNPPMTHLRKSGFNY